jgi:hypothetical protein
MIMTDKPFLDPTVIDHLVDIVSEKASEGEYSESGLSVLRSMGKYDNGIRISATVAARSMVSHTHSPRGSKLITQNPRQDITTRQWI